MELKETSDTQKWRETRPEQRWRLREGTGDTKPGDGLLLPNTHVTPQSPSQGLAPHPTHRPCLPLHPTPPLHLFSPSSPTSLNHGTPCPTPHLTLHPPPFPIPYTLLKPTPVHFTPLPPTDPYTQAPQPAPHPSTLSLLHLCTPSLLTPAPLSPHLQGAFAVSFHLDTDCAAQGELPGGRGSRSDGTGEQTSSSPTHNLYPRNLCLATVSISRTTRPAVPNL